MEAVGATLGVAGGAPPATVDMTYCCAQTRPPKSRKPQGGRNGRLSIQTDPRFYRNPQAIVKQAVAFSQLAPNMIVKIPATRAGIPAMEEATYRGISINATVSFTLPQAIAVAGAVERGLARREKEGLDIRFMGPVCTIMVGRLDDLLKVLLET